MPSPVAHSLIGLTLGFARFLPGGGSWRELMRQAWNRRGWLFLCIVLANAPDIDYIFGIPKGNLNYYHHTITHTLGWIVLVSLAVWIYTWSRRHDLSIRGLLFILALTGSHLIADFFCADNSPPYGFMLFWPFSDSYWLSPVSLFPAPAKKAWADLWTLHNAGVVTVELLVTLPLAAAVLAWKRFKPATNYPPQVG